MSGLSLVSSGGLALGFRVAELALAYGAFRKLGYLVLVSL